MFTKCLMFEWRHSLSLIILIEMFVTLIETRLCLQIITVVYGIYFCFFTFTLWSSLPTAMQPTVKMLISGHFMLVFPSHLHHDACGAKKKKPLHKLSLPGMNGWLIRGCHCTYQLRETQQDKNTPGSRVLLADQMGCCQMRKAKLSSSMSEEFPMGGLSIELPRLVN